MLRRPSRRSLTLASAALLAAGCAAAPQGDAFAVTPISPAERAMHTRVFATDDEAAVLGACIAVLRAHGFSPEDEEPALGLIVASKDGEAAGARTRLRASIAAQSAGEFGLATQVRVTFQRLAWNPRGRETLREAVREAGEYAGFFEEVAQALALPEPSAE